MEANGDGEEPALLLRFPQGAKSGGKRRVGIHSGNVVIRGARGGARLYSSDGQRRSGGRTKGSGGQRRTRRGDDARRCEGVGVEVVHIVARRGVDGSCFSGGD